MRFLDATTEKELVFLTNHVDLEEATVAVFGVNCLAAIYKQPRPIELLFKALKRNLRIKTFVGTTANVLNKP